MAKTETENERVDRELWSAKGALWDQQVGAEGDRNRRYNVHPVLWRMLGDVSGKRVLDAGCGTGYLAIKLARADAHVTAVDYAEGMLSVAREKIAAAGVDVELAQDSCCVLDSVESASQDVLVSNYVLQDVEDYRAALRAFRRVLVDGGTAVLILGHPCFGNPGGPERHEDGSFSYRWPFPYFDEVRCEESWQGTHAETGARFDFPDRFTYYHRPLSAYWKAIQDADLVVTDFDEPTVRPPYPPEFDPDLVRRYQQCAFSVAFQVRAGK